jgi:predicted metal-dependent hydrolase
VNNNHIEIDGISIEILRKPIKNMHVRIYPPDGRVQISAPMRLNINYIYKQVEAKLTWLHTQRAKLQSQPVLSELTMHTGESHFFLGQAYTLIVHETQNPKQVILKDNELLLSTKPNATLAEKEAILKRWYQTQMHNLVPDLIKKWQPIIDVSVADWGVKTMKTRWGSCNVRMRRIWLNLVLIKKPILCLEYVLVHELVHLLEASHNTRFYQLMDKFMPEWRTHQKALYL